MNTEELKKPGKRQSSSVSLKSRSKSRSWIDNIALACYIKWSKEGKMSDEISTVWLERASEVMTFFEGKQPALVIERDLENNDWAALVAHVALGEAQMAQQEFEATDVL